MLHFSFCKNYASNRLRPPTLSLLCTFLLALGILLLNVAPSYASWQRDSIYKESDISEVEDPAASGDIVVSVLGKYTLDTQNGGIGVAQADYSFTTTGPEYYLDLHGHASGTVTATYSWIPNEPADNHDMKVTDQLMWDQEGNAGVSFGNWYPSGTGADGTTWTNTYSISDSVTSYSLSGYLYADAQCGGSFDIGPPPGHEEGTAYAYRYWNVSSP